jgi:hypothetical protein
LSANASFVDLAPAAKVPQSRSSRQVGSVGLAQFDFLKDAHNDPAGRLLAWFMVNPDASEAFSSDVNLDLHVCFHRQA